MDEHETVDLVIRLEIAPGTDEASVTNAMVSAAESVDGVLAAWREEGGL